MYLMRPLVSICSGLRRHNSLDHCHAAHDLMSLDRGILRARFEQCRDAATDHR